MDINKELYKKVFLIRYAEEQIIKYYPEDGMKTPMHMSMGSEAIAAGVCQALRPSDQVLGTYRSHALYLSKTGDTDNFFLEMYGKKSGIANGKNGSMHLCNLDFGLLCCSAIVGSTVPVAVGVAFANKYKNNGKIVAVFFGDGAMDEGVFWESLNFACLKKLPILFVYEDNDLAVHSFNKNRRGFMSVPDVISGYKNLIHYKEFGDVYNVYTKAKVAIGLMLEYSYPCFLQICYHRYLEHVGINEDYDAGYREKVDWWHTHDPVKSQRENLTIPEDEIQNVENEIRQKVDRSIQLARHSEFANTEEVHKGVFC